MIRLINGRGQLGESLARLIEERKLVFPDDVAVYHTWNFLDKSEEVQKACYNAFTQFVDQHPDTRILFTSTYSQADNPYNYYKQAAEAYLINRHQKGSIIRLPAIVGKGVFERFRTEDIQPFGEMEIVTLREATEEVLKFLQSGSRIRSTTVRGHMVPANVVKELILFGRDGKASC